MELRDINTLYDSPVNTLTEITPEAAEALREELKRGQHSTILITQSGEIIGGKHRVEVWKELGVEKVKCIVLSWLKDEELGYYPLLDGDVVTMKDAGGGLYIPEHFDSVEELKMAYSMSHNNEFVHYDKERLEQATHAYKLDWDTFRVPVVPIPTVKESMKKFLIQQEEELEENSEKGNRKAKMVTCPKCYNEFTL